MLQINLKPFIVIAYMPKCLTRHLLEAISDVTSQHVKSVIGLEKCHLTWKVSYTKVFMAYNFEQKK